MMCSRSESLAATVGIGACIVDLSDGDDDEDVVLLKEFPPHLANRAPKKPRSDTKPVLLNSNLVILEDVLDKNAELNFGSGLQKDSQKSSQNSCSLLDEDDCCILDEDPLKVGMVKTGCDGNDSDDLVMTGEVGQVACRDFPHARHLCVQLPFKTTPHISFCSQCHCYVCDILAPCSLWGDGSRGGDHCHASDNIEEKWKVLRQYNKTYPTGCSDPVVGNSESTSFRELIACHVGDSARSQHPLQRADSARSQRSLQRSSSVKAQHPLQGDDSSRAQRTLQRGVSSRSHLPALKYPLQISLNTRSHPRRHHTQGLGVRAAKFHMYVHRKGPQYSSTYGPHQLEGCGDCQPKRIDQQTGSFSSHFPQSCTNPGSVQTSHRSFSAIMPRRLTAAAIHGEQESSGGMVTDGDIVSNMDSLGKLDAAEAFLGLSSPDRPEDLRQQCNGTGIRTTLNPVNADQSQNDIGAQSSQGDETVESCNSIHIGTQFSEGSLIEDMVQGSMGSLPTSPPTLLVDYLLNGDDFWNN